MKIKAKPVVRTFNLTTDPDGEATVSVRQAREGETQERLEMLSTITRVYEEAGLGTMKLQQSVNRRKLMRREAFLTLASITGIVDEEGAEIFSSRDTVDGQSIRGAMSEATFNMAWDRLPPEVVTEIIGFVYDVNPTWDPENQGE
jgi:hypothetical protein